MRMAYVNLFNVSCLIQNIYYFCDFLSDLLIYYTQYAITEHPFRLLMSVLVPERPKSIVKLPNQTDR